MLLCYSGNFIDNGAGLVNNGFRLAVEFCGFRDLGMTVREVPILISKAFPHR